MPDKRTENCLYFLRIPATDEGRSFIRQLKGYLNTDSYTYETRYTGKRPKGTNPVSTLKENAESIRLYVRNKDRPFGANYDVNGHTHRLKVENEKLKKDIEALHKELGNCTKEESYEQYQEGSLYMQGFNKGKARINELNKEVDKLNKTLSAKDTVISNYQNDMDLRQREIDRLNTKVDDSPSYNRLKVENRELKKEIDRLDMKIDNEVCEGSCVSQEDYDEALELKDSMREELKALNKSSADFLRHKLAEALELLKEGSEEIKSLDKSKFSMRKEIIALNKSLAEAHASVSDLRDTVRDVREERDDALDINKDLRIRLESAKEEESITHIKHHYLGSIPEDDVLYWMKIGYLFYNKVEGNDVKSNG